MILMNENRISYLVGNGILSDSPMEIYSDLVCFFLDELSKIIRGNLEAKKYPDVLTFAFWCRRGNIQKLKEEYVSKYVRVGRGNVFHIAPSNVPINFAFSLVFGLLAGNSNVVRVSEKEFEQVNIVCECINRCLEIPEFCELKKYICVVKYPHCKEITDDFSQKCASRVIWGGDNTIKEIRKSEIPCRTNEITFSDRYSFAIFDEETMENDSDSDLKVLAEKFYNDTYLMDQNACSSPHLIMWMPSKSRQGRLRFWDMLNKIAVKYDMQAKKAVDKYTLAAELAARNEIEFNLKIYSNTLYVAQLKEMSDRVDILRGKFGLFFETDYTSAEEICRYIGNKVQTCVVYGLDADGLERELIKNHCLGVDRIVEVGKAMDIGTYWDGYDIIGTLSRAIVVG